jgi:hypothetical protein
MFIIVEGTDASGKSSLISEITRQVSESYPNQQISYFHKGRPDEETRRWVLEEYAIDVSLVDWRASIAIADRWHWGEVTYAPLKRAHTCTDDFGLLGASGWRWVELFLMSRGASQFWLHQPLEVIQKRLSSRGDTFVSPDELAYILERYTFCANNAVANLAGELTPQADSMETISSLAQQVISVASARAQDAARLANYPEYIGPPRPSALLVGDKRNDKSVTVLPFMPVDNNSGDYLMSCLPDPFWKTVGIINGDDINGKRLQRLLVELGEPPVVALGRMAERSLKISGMGDSDYVVVPHPQYVRRFHHHDRLEYGNAIERLSKIGKKVVDPWVLP